MYLGVQASCYDFVLMPASSMNMPPRVGAVILISDQDRHILISFVPKKSKVLLEVSAVQNPDAKTFRSNVETADAPPILGA